MRVLKDVGSRLATAAAIYITVRQVILLSVGGSYSSRIDNNFRFAAVQEVGVAPQGCYFLTVSIGHTCITVINIVICSAGIVTLTHRCHVTAAIDVAYYGSSVHGHAGITKYLTGSQTVNLSSVFSSTANLVQLLVIGVLTLTATVDGMPDQTFGQGNFRVADDMAVLTAAIYRTGYTVIAVFGTKANTWLVVVGRC